MFRFVEYLYLKGLLESLQILYLLFFLLDRKQCENVKTGRIDLVSKEKGSSCSKPQRYGCLCTSSEIVYIKEKLKAKQIYVGYSPFGVQIFSER